MRCIFALALILLPVSIQAQPSRGFNWFSDYSKGLAEAKKTGKPIFLVFRCEP